MKIVALQFDLGRQKESVSFIKSMADFAVNYGYNTIVLYLETCVRTQDTAFFNKDETYSVQEMQEMISYMESIGLDVIPAFENLGHMEKFLDYEQFAEFAEVQDCSKQGRGWWYPRYKHGQNGCVTNVELRAFMDKYVTEVASLFHSKYVHMGLDEVFDFATCPRCKEVLAQGKTHEDLFTEHILHCHKLVADMGKQMMMWDDFFEYFDVVERLPRDIIFCTWNYYYIGDELNGKWTNRVKRDSFRIYDELGFQYLFCTDAHNGGSTFNVDSFSQYAEKFSPLGALMTTWERSARFYQGLLPIIAYAGRLWNGKLQTYQQKVACYTELLGNEECAKLILSLQLPSFMAGYTGVTDFAENDYFVKCAMRSNYAYALGKLGEYLAKTEGFTYDILVDMYDYILDYSLSLRLQKLGSQVFDAYETHQPTDKFVDELEQIKCGYEQIKRNGDRLWHKYRNGILSCDNAYENEYRSKIAELEQIKADLSANKQRGVLYFDAMMHDAYSTVKAEIKVKYVGRDGEVTVHKGAIKPTIACLDIGACYGFRFAIDDCNVEYAVLDVYGEGALWGLNVRYLAHGTKYVADTVTKLYGLVENENNMLRNDTTFATLGYNDGKTHLCDDTLAKKHSGVKITFAPMVNKE